MSTQETKTGRSKRVTLTENEERAVLRMRATGASLAAVVQRLRHQYPGGLYDAEYSNTAIRNAVRRYLRATGETSGYTTAKQKVETAMMVPSLVSRLTDREKQLIGAFLRYGGYAEAAADQQASKYVVKRTVERFLRLFRQCAMMEPAFDGLSTRALNALKRAGITTADQVHALGLPGVRKIWNCGEKTAQEIWERVGIVAGWNAQK